VDGGRATTLAAGQGCHVRLTLTFVLAIVEILALKGGLSSLSLTIRYPHEHTHVSVSSLGRPAVRAACRCTVEGGWVGGWCEFCAAGGALEKSRVHIGDEKKFMTSTQLPQLPD
jgi:hypothetical protein